MRVQRVVKPVTAAESWTVLGDDGAVVVPVEAHMAHLAALLRSPNTVRAYATSLKLWFEFLAQAGVGWAEAVYRSKTYRVPSELVFMRSATPPGSTR